TLEKCKVNLCIFEVFLCSPRAPPTGARSRSVVAEEAISKTARVLEEADISEEKRDVIHREIGKFRESMK
ncbi:jg247, partial [Pararge aegeria aegeria]